MDIEAPLSAAATILELESRQEEVLRLLGDLEAKLEQTLRDSQLQVAPATILRPAA
ncbi:MAG: hypothetical protein SFX18_03195 [Pirellulales bacterium]|nr:hypothetical protein [Pirellulales bacterium]